MMSWTFAGRKEGSLSKALSEEEGVLISFKKLNFYTL
jgi:hypothetical protein